MRVRQRIPDLQRPPYVAQGKLRRAEMVTHHFALDDIATAFRVLRDRDGDPFKVVIVPGPEV